MYTVRACWHRATCTRGSQPLRGASATRPHGAAAFRWLPAGPPEGGGLKHAESPLTGARREFTEETGLPGEAVVDRQVLVQHAFAWFGTPMAHVERFLLARVPEHAPRTLRPDADHRSVGHSGGPMSSVDE